MRLHLLGFGLSIALVTTACDNGPPTGPTATAAMAVSVAIDGPAQLSLDEPGSTVQLRAVATLDDGTRPDVTNEADWEVTNRGVVTVSRGLVTGTAFGGTIVAATYRGRSAFTTVRVGGTAPVVQVSGVVLDAVSGAPVVDADIIQGGWEDQRVVSRTDGSGFFNLGDHRGPVSFGVSRFGYQTAFTSLSNVREPTRVDVRLRPNPGDYIERSITGRFEPPGPGTDRWFSTVRLNLRVGAVFDALLETPTCAGGPMIQLAAANGSATISSAFGPCRANVTFVVASPDVSVSPVGMGAADWVLTYRESR